ncbi:hypothetical protein ACIQOV_01715 [Kitasatospora sp. NPDC091257]|uniref:hypothetical protein n=1 Tax=Kitasatospora sp. NPDC091257 TaxID=3364084 RepID=UPI00381C4CBE
MDARERLRIGPAAGGAVVAGGHDDVREREDDLAGVTLEEAVGEVAAEREGAVESGLGAPEGESAVSGHAVEHQAAHHRPAVLFGCLGDLAEWGRVRLELVGVGEQVPAGAGLLPQRVAQFGVGVLVPRSGADLAGGEAEALSGVQ